MGDLNAVDLTAELGKRVRALARLSRQIRMRDVKSVRDDDLWVIYVMLIENGGYTPSDVVRKLIAI